MKNNNLKISIITPSYNSVDSIERAIKSVLLQDYQNWEHLVIDGASTDGTVQILEKYKHLKWISEKDKGQSDAMNKGFELSTGEIIVYLNDDDYFLPGAFTAVIEKFNEGADFVVGDVLVKSPRLNAEFINYPKTEFKEMIRHWEPNAFCVNSVGYFYKRSVQIECPFDISNHDTMDLQFLLEASTKFKFTKVDKTLGCFEDQIHTKTGVSQSMLNYWNTKSFPYIEKLLPLLNEVDLEKFMIDRRNGFLQMQSHMNALNKHPVELIEIGSLPKVSVIISTYNCEKYINRAIDSVLNQKLQNFEVIVVDDASTDGTKLLLENTYRNNPNVKIITNSNNQKQGAGRNIALEKANGKYIFFLDSDDWIEPDSLQYLISISEKYNSEITVCGVNSVCENGEKQFYHGYDFSCNGGVEALEFYADYKIGSIVWNKLYLRDFIEKNNIRFITPYWHEDVIFSIECAYLCSSYISVSKPLYNYFQREGSVVHSTPNVFHLRSYIKLFKYMSDFLQKYKIENTINGKLLCEKLIHAHCTNVVMTQFNQFIETKEESVWRRELLEACLLEFGHYGYALSEFIVTMVLQKGNIVHTDSNDIFQKRYEEINNSLGWKVILKIRSVSVKLFPLNSRRRKILSNVINMVRKQKSS